MDLQKVLEKHAMWLSDKEGGERADLRGADLRWANLRWANLRDADLRDANLRGANLSRADLSWANLDYSCWPLWCGSLGARVDKRLFAQLAYHLCRVVVEDDECKEAQAALSGIANQFHRAEECGFIEKAAQDGSPDSGKVVKTQS